MSHNIQKKLIQKQNNELPTIDVHSTIESDLIKIEKKITFLKKLHLSLLQIVKLKQRKTIFYHNFLSFAQ